MIELMKKIFLILILVLLVVTGCGKDKLKSGKVDGISYKETKKETDYFVYYNNVFPDKSLVCNSLHAFLIKFISA